jgi:mannan endo-1,4-beta-mannosidase
MLTCHSCLATMKQLSGLVALLSIITAASAQSTAPVYGQCGGIGWTGPTVCASGSACVVSNPYYSQCIPGAASSTAPTSTVGHSSTSTTPSPTATVTGFVKTSGTKFTLNGKTFSVVGYMLMCMAILGYD